MRGVNVEPVQVDRLEQLREPGVGQFKRVHAMEVSHVQATTVPVSK